MPFDLNAIARLLAQRASARTELHVSRDALDVARLRRDNAQDEIKRIEAVLGRVSAGLALIFDTNIPHNATLDQIIEILEPPTPPAPPVP